MPRLVGSGSTCPVAALCDPVVLRRYRDPAGFIHDPANPDRGCWLAMQDRISSGSRKDSGSVPMPAFDPYQEMASIIARFRAHQRRRISDRDRQPVLQPAVIPDPAAAHGAMALFRARGPGRQEPGARGGAVPLWRRRLSCGFARSSRRLARDGGERRRAASRPRHGDRAGPAEGCAGPGRPGTIRPCPRPDARGGHQCGPARTARCIVAAAAPA